VPDGADHTRLAEHNSTVISALRTHGDSFPDWVTTVAFYEALHHIEALFFHDHKAHGVDHPSRLGILKKKNRYERICRHYVKLQEASNIARYLSARPTGKTYSQFTDYMTMAEVIEKVLDGHLKQLKQSVATLMTPQEQHSAEGAPDDGPPAMT